MKKLACLAILAIINCNQINNSSSQHIQNQELLGVWTSTHVSIQRCILNGDTLPPDTAIDRSTYSISQDSIIMCIRKPIRSACGIIPLPTCNQIIAKWKLSLDTLFAYPVPDSSGMLTDTAKFAIFRYSSGEMIFSSAGGIFFAVAGFVDTCSRQ